MSPDRWVAASPLVSCAKAVSGYRSRMTLGHALVTSLKAIGPIMAQAHDPWWIIASAAVALHGADAGHVSDVDVLLSIADARRILPGIGIAPRAGSAHAAFRSSIFGTWSDTALPVEFMAGFERLSGTQWFPVLPVTRQAVRVESGVVFVPEKTELEAMLIAFGRPKDLERARKLASMG